MRNITCRRFPSCLNLEMRMAILFGQSPPHVIPSFQAIAPALFSIAVSSRLEGGLTALSHAKRPIWRQRTYKQE